MRAIQLQQLPIWKAVLALALVAVLSLALQIWRMYSHWGYNGIQIPLSFGVVKDVLDVAIVLLYGWGAWPVVIIEITGRVFELSLSWRFWVCVISAAVYGVFSALHSFDFTAPAQILTSVVTAECIYGMSVLLSFVSIEVCIYIYSRRECLLPK